MDNTKGPKARNRKMVVNYIVFCIDVSKSASKSWEMFRRAAFIVGKIINTFIHYVGEEAYTVKSRI